VCSIRKKVEYFEINLNKHLYTGRMCGASFLALAWGYKINVTGVVVGLFLANGMFFKKCKH